MYRSSTFNNGKCHQYDVSSYANSFSYLYFFTIHIMNNIYTDFNPISFKFRMDMKVTIYTIDERKNINKTQQLLDIAVFRAENKCINISVYFL